MAKRSLASFKDLTFFSSRMEGINTDDLHREFQLYQSYNLDTELNMERADHQWVALGVGWGMDLGNCCFQLLGLVMLSLPSIPHSNSNAERAFSMVRENRTSQRASLSASTLEAILVSKFGPQGQINDKLLQKCKSATFSGLK